MHKEWSPQRRQKRDVRALEIHFFQDSLVRFSDRRYNLQYIIFVTRVKGPEAKDARTTSSSTTKTYGGAISRKTFSTGNVIVTASQKVRGSVASGIMCCSISPFYSLELQRKLETFWIFLLSHFRKRQKNSRRIKVIRQGFKILYESSDEDPAKGNFKKFINFLSLRIL